MKKSPFYKLVFIHLIIKFPFLWNPKGCHNSPSMYPFLNHMNPIHILTTCLNIILWSYFPTKILYAFLTSPAGALYLTQFILFDLNTLLFSEEYRLRCQLLCNFLEPPVPSFLLDKLFFSEPCSQTPSMYVLPFG